MTTSEQQIAADHHMWVDTERPAIHRSARQQYSGRKVAQALIEALGI